MATHDLATGLGTEDITIAWDCELGAWPKAYCASPDRVIGIPRTAYGEVSTALSLGSKPPMCKNALKMSYPEIK